MRRQPNLGNGVNEHVFDVAVNLRIAHASNYFIRVIVVYICSSVYLFDGLFPNENSFVIVAYSFPVLPD